MRRPEEIPLLAAEIRAELGKLARLVEKLARLYASLERAQAAP
jgi:hypothetical protein